MKDRDWRRLNDYVVSSLIYVNQQSVLLLELEKIKNEDTTYYLKNWAAFSTLKATIKESLSLYLINMLDRKQGILWWCYKAITEDQQQEINNLLTNKQSTIDIFIKKIRNQSIGHHTPDWVINWIDKSLLETYSSTEIISRIPLAEKVWTQLLKVLSNKSTNTSWDDLLKIDNIHIKKQCENIFSR